SVCALKKGQEVLAVALAIWFMAGLRGREENLPLTTKTVGLFSVKRPAKSRAVTTLEKAGLIKVDRRDRRNPLVTILVSDKAQRSLDGGGWPALKGSAMRRA